MRKTFNKFLTLIGVSITVFFISMTVTFAQLIRSTTHYYDNYSAYAYLESDAEIDHNLGRFKVNFINIRTNLSLSSQQKRMNESARTCYATFTGTTPNYNTVTDTIVNQH